MPAISAREASHDLPHPPIRLRSLLFVGVMAGFVWWAYPRARAAWQLHDQAVALANYALCMVGPTGPTLLRDNPSRFWQLVRRRLLGARSRERPFAACADKAFEITGSTTLEEAHAATAFSFREYGGVKRSRAQRPEFTLHRLRLGTDELARLADEAWPFFRGGYSRLVRPTRGAKESTHPVPPARPSLGRGLPRWRSYYRTLRAVESGHVLAVGQGAHLSTYLTRDGGRTWKTVSAARARAEEFGERCLAGEDGQAFTFNTNEDGSRLLVTSLAPAEAPSATELTTLDHVLFSASCDEKALVAAYRPKRSRRVHLALCAFRGACRELSLPNLGSADVVPHYPLDVARMHGVTIVAMTLDGVVRVSSSRDDGETWAPFSVAYDRAEHPQLSHLRAPSRLLPLGKRLLLYAGADDERAPYPVLFSDDFGASFRSK